MKHWLLLVLLGALLAACGGGDGEPEEPGDRNIGWVDIDEPIDDNGTYTTRSSSIEIAGNAFVSPADADCAAIQPVQLTLTWRNDSSGQSGRGSIRSFCQNTFLGFQRVSSWIVPAGDIDLQFGDNVIAITAADGAGNSGTATINVLREKDVAPPVIVTRQPASGAADVAVNQSITVTFSEAMLLSSLTDERFTVTDPHGFAIDGFLGYDDRNFRWQFDPQFGLLYSTATLLSGCLLPFFGPLIDRVNLRGYSVAVGLLMVAALLATAFAPALIVLFLGVLGLRFSGQGLMTQIGGSPQLPPLCGC